MSQKFLTLDGQPPRRRNLNLFDLGFIRPPEKRTTNVRDVYRETDEAEAAERTAKRRAHLYEDADAKVDPKAKGLFAMYEEPSEMGASEGLGWSFRRWVSRATTPPRALRRFVRPPKVFRKLATRVSNLGRKGLRYGMAISTLPLTAFGGGKLRNQVFGLKGKELKQFDAAAKVYRVAAVAVATVVGAPAVMSALGSAGSAGLGMLKTAGGFVMKAGPSVWKVAKGPLGDIVASKFNKNQVPPDALAELPEGQPVPVNPNYSGGAGGGQRAAGQDDEDAEGIADDVGTAPSVAGSGGMNPDGGEWPRLKAGEESSFDREAIDRQPSMLPFPNVLSNDSEIDDEMTAKIAAIQAKNRADAEGGAYREQKTEVNEAEVAEKFKGILDEPQAGDDPVQDALDLACAVSHEKDRSQKRRSRLFA